jgi:hypothetical protein
MTVWLATDSCCVAEKKCLNCPISNSFFSVSSFQECPTGSPDFRQAQCESYNGKQFMGRYYLWEAYWDGTYKTITAVILRTRRRLPYLRNIAPDPSDDLD